MYVFIVLALLLMSAVLPKTRANRSSESRNMTLISFEMAVKERNHLLLEQPHAIAVMPQERPRRALTRVFRDDFNSLDLSLWEYEVSMYGGYVSAFPSLK